MGCIIAMDETAVWHKIIFNTKVTDKEAKSVVLKTLGHEKSKVTVTLAANANGDKQKPYIIFPGHKRRSWNKKSLLRRITINGWMNENKTIHWVENVLKTFTFGKKNRPRCLSWWSK